jgi:arsenite-transporting ATPase
MSDIDVEPVDDTEGADREAPADDEVGHRSVSVDVESVASGTPEYVLYGGKGGVGKTTMAAATGLASAFEGTPTLVVSTDPAHSLSDTYGTRIGPRPERIREDVPLYGVEIDPDEAMDEAAVFGGDGGALGGLGGMLGDEDGEGLLGSGMPGADEAAAIQQLMRLLDDDRFERVVVDTAPTGHTLRLLELPELLDSMAGRILTLRQRLSGMLSGMKGMFGGEDDDPEADMQDLREVRERVERLRATLQDPAKTDFRVVMVPEEMSVTESERLLERLEGFDIPVGTVVVNRVMEDLADVVDAEADDVVSPNLDSCEFCQRRWQVQKAAIERADRIFRGHDIKRVPLFADEVRGERTLRTVAACLS